MNLLNTIYKQNNNKATVHKLHVMYEIYNINRFFLLDQSKINKLQCRIKIMNITTDGTKCGDIWMQINMNGKEKQIKLHE